MDGIVHHTECPVCGQRDFNPLLTVKDHTVSKENFVIWQCNKCTLRFTQDAPDEKAIGKYYQSEDYISHTNSDKGFINKIYQSVRKITLKKKSELVEESTGLKTGQLLDLGCGTGAFLHTMKERGWKVKGVEPDEGARATAKKLYGLQIDPSNYLSELPHNTFDVITLWHVLEHVHPIHEYIEKLKTLLSKKAKLFIAVPNYNSADADIYNLNWAAYDVPRHLYHFTPFSMSSLMEKHGLKIIKKKPMWFDSFYVSLLSSKYRNGKTKLMPSFINGLRSNIGAMINTDRCSSIIYIVTKA